MAQLDWSARLARTIAGEIRRYRQRRGLSAQQLADACAELGMPIQRSVLANLENGRRATVSVAELIVLAKALRVPPILLVFPVGQEEMIEVLPGRTVPTWQAAKWFTGEEPFPGQPWGVKSTDFDAWQEGGAPVDLYRWHDRYVSDWRSAKSSADAQRKAAGVAATEAERDALLRAADTEERRARDIERILGQHRQMMRQHGIKPPELTSHLSHVDEEVASR